MIRALAWATIAIAVAAVVVAELAMDMTPRDRFTLYVVFGVMALVTAAVAAAAVRWAPRLTSLVTSLRVVAFAAVVVAAGVVAAAALTMFIEPHDLTLVLVALLLGVGLGGVLAVAVAGPLTTDLGRLAAVATSVGEGRKDVATGVDRRDELGEAARAVDAMIGRLADAEAAERAATVERRALIASVGHDLRTPLASLQASVEALQDGVAPDPDRYLRGMATDIHHLRRLVDDLFLLARLDAGSHRVDPQPVDLAELADEAVEALTPLARARKVVLEADAPGPVPSMADPAVVGRILRNLVDNAVRHSHAGGRVTVAVGDGEGGPSIEVVDEGPGFPEAYRSIAFERFARVDAARTRGDDGGAGLGLAIAKELAELSDGRIDLGAGPGGRVKVTLPSADASPNRSRH